jgi:hypothetical protein
MSLVNWFRNAAAPNTSPRLEGLLFKVAQYLSENIAHDEFTPKIIAKALSESELAATTALSILERRGITKHHFGVYCNQTSDILENYDELTDIPNEIYCVNCDEEHSLGDKTCKVDLYFTVDKSKLADFLARASSAA